MDQGDVFWATTVDYGDGSGSQPLAVDFDTQTFDLNHTYTTTGTYTVTVTINDSDPSTEAGVATFDLDVQKVVPGPFAITGTGSPVVN